jgi:hypothetical protein
MCTKLLVQQQFARVEFPGDRLCIGTDISESMKEDRLKMKTTKLKQGEAPLQSRIP